MIGDSVDAVVDFLDSAKGELGMDLFTGEAREPIHYAKKNGSYWLALESSNIYFNQGTIRGDSYGCIRDATISTTASLSRCDVQDKVMALPVSYDHYISIISFSPPTGAIDFQLLANEPRLKARFSTITATFPYKDTTQCLNTLKFNQQIYDFLIPGGKFVVTTDFGPRDLTEKKVNCEEYKFPFLMREVGFNVRERLSIAGLTPSAFGRSELFTIVHKTIGKNPDLLSGDWDKD